MASRLLAGETLKASVVVSAPPHVVYRVVSDPVHIPKWSPETVRVRWLSSDRFESHNRRGIGRWRTVARVVEVEQDTVFAFVVEAFGGDWTRWSYLVEEGPTPGSTRLTEEFQMCVSLPTAALVFERVCLFVWNRRRDLQRNLESSVDRIKNIVEQGTVGTSDSA